MSYADCIIERSHYRVDQIYQYLIPASLKESIKVGVRIQVPFGKGNTLINAYVVGISEQTDYDPAKIKEVSGIVKGAVPVQDHLLVLAAWMKDQYGGTFHDAIRTVLPVKQSVKTVQKEYVRLAVSRERSLEMLEEYGKKNYKAKERLLKVLLGNGQEDGRDAALKTPAKSIDKNTIPDKEEVRSQESQIAPSAQAASTQENLCQEISTSVLRQEYQITKTVLKSLEKDGIISISTQRLVRNPVEQMQKKQGADKKIVLNEGQQKVVDEFLSRFEKGDQRPGLLHGITGSGKTEVYMAIMEAVIAGGQQVIVLIPEISLTYQTVNRFRERFHDQVAIGHSRLSQGERYDQQEQARNGEVNIMIGTRSALFTPFTNLGLIIIDEEHDNSYKSENVPRYHARETAIERARLSKAGILMGSATPTLESYKKAMEGEYQLYELDYRAGAGTRPKVSLVDLRQEYQMGNYSMFSQCLMEKLTKCLARGEQAMLFMNRRGFAPTITCRNCGTVVKCPHCDISLTLHKKRNGEQDFLFCHYCGYTREPVTVCPKCESKSIGSFGGGTQKVEDALAKAFPTARILRMDADTTSGKDGHEKLLHQISEGEADFIVGTQMIVKGHDFPNVTLMGILAADLSLHAQDYRAVEQTFALLVQASGRVGRADKPGEVVIQTYQPEHYGLVLAKEGDYQGFYRKEIVIRKNLGYPPAHHMLAVLITAPKEENAQMAGPYLLERLKKYRHSSWDKLEINGPMPALIGKLRDQYRYRIYFRHEDYDVLKQVKDILSVSTQREDFRRFVLVQYDFDPLRTD